MNWGDPEPTFDVPNRFWMPVLPWTVHAVWVACNSSGRARYAVERKRKLFPWQYDPDLGRDLPDRVPPGMLD